MSSFTEYLSYDSWGNPSNIRTTTGDLTEFNTIAYGQHGSWCPNKPLSITTTLQSIVREKAFVYDTKGNLTKGTIDPTNVNKVITEYKDFDDFGHAQTVEVTANDITRSSFITYTPSGRFVLSKINVLGDTIMYNWDETRGLLNSETNRMGTTLYTYNGLGRLTDTRYPDGIRKADALQWASPGNSYNAKYYTYSETSGTAPMYVWYDALGREVVKETFGLNNRKIRLFTQYKSDGKIERVSEPTFNTSTGTWAAVCTYDMYGRPETVTTPMGITRTAYAGKKTTVSSPTDIIVRNLYANGLLEYSEQNGKRVTYTYYPSGLPKTTTPVGGQSLTMEYDLQGNRTKLIDPDAGTIESQYNGFGEQLWNRQAMHQGQIITTTTNYAPGTGLIQNIVRNGETTIYSYDPLNRIESIEITGKHKQSFTYGDFDRIIQVNEYIDGRVFTTGTEYDALGREKKRKYNSGYYANNFYDAYGNLTEVKDKYDRSIYKPLEENARGQLTRINRGGRETTFGFDTRGLPTSIQSTGVIDLTYSFNAKGNLGYRQDNLTSQKEQFGYDGLNRLTNWNVYQNNVLAKQNSLSFDDRGNIQSRSDLDNLTMNYGDNGRPHALTSISGVPTVMPLDSLSVTYTDFKKIATLSEGSKYYALTYGVDDQRRKSVYKVNGVTKQTRYYLGDYEEEIDFYGNIRKIHYLSGGAVFIQNYNKDSLLYGYADYQGSLTALTDANGNVLERYAYDPWGQRRDPDDWTQTDSRTGWRLNRGYTGHEHLDVFCIINMNGRVYDPLTGMFFSPDPYIQDLGNWLNYNRYGYCYGNPFMYTDPDGQFFIAAILIGAAISGTVGYFSGRAAGLRGSDLIA